VVADFTYVPTWSGMVYVAFVIDAYSRQILGLARRRHDAHQPGPRCPGAGHLDPSARRPGQPGRLLHHHDAGSQYTSIAFTERLAAAGAQPSVGTVGDVYDNALAETVFGLYKTELIKPRAPWRTPEQVEVATLHYVDWFNHQRLFETCGDIPPAELERRPTTVRTPASPRPASHQTESPDSPGRFRCALVL